ncbi:MAG TPA: sensor histidine kinase [Rudaea sp.]|nr:sensor histidine kinase [Rudaea sp.]
MKPLRPQLRGLIFKLAVFYALLSLPSLMLVESALLLFEFHAFMGEVDAGSLARATERGAAELAEAWPSQPQDEAKSLAVWVQSWVLRMQQPRGGLIERESYILLELASDPLAAAVLAPDGHVLARSPADPRWPLSLPVPGDTAYTDAAAHRLPGAETPDRIRRVLAPIRTTDGSLRGFLFVELRLPVPWHRLPLDLSLEWPVVLGYLIVFGIASSLFLAAWVTRRLNRVARAAAAWSRGDFSDRIEDTSRDELGRLSAQLDEMALELKALMRSRAQLAILAERQRLARDLHDTVKQQAFALSLQLAAVRRQLGEHPAAERVAHAERLGQQMQRELVQILDELRAADSELPFAERLRRRALEWAQASGLKLRLELAELASAPTEIEEALLRITDEALANVMRHSGAEEARLTLRCEGTDAELAIEDNGRGPRADMRPGMGLANMRERAESLPHGRFEFERGEHEGTRIRIHFSLAGTLA